MNRLRFTCLFVSILTAGIASATVFERITDRQLVERSDAVVVGLIRDAFPRQTAEGIVTDYHLIVEEALKGTVPDTLTITELGGVIGTRAVFVADGAEYTPGERVMAFLRKRPDGTYFTTSMALGKFTFARDANGQAIVVRHASELHEPARLQKPFENFVRSGARGEIRYVSVTARTPVANGNAKQYALTASGFPVRWFNATVPFLVNGSLSFSTTNGINNGMVAWTNDPASNITLTNAGPTAINAPNQNDNKNVILLGYAGSPGLGGVCDGSSACTVGAGGLTSTFDGDTWVAIDDADIMIRPSVVAAQFDSLMTHEFGHAIGIRHSDQGSPADSSAIMASSVPASFGSNLQQWDKDAVDSLYGNGPVCRPVVITAVTGGGTVASGTSATLFVSVTGTPPFTYQWYDGAAPDTTVPVGTNSDRFTTPPITTTKNFWVKVTNTCGTANSTTITLTPQVCVRPAITIQPQSQMILPGGTATLTVGNSGSGPFFYQWYQGQSGDTSSPVGTNASQFTTPAVTRTTSYWVRVTNSCGSADSATATIVTEGPCPKPTFTLQPAGVVLDPGQQTFLIAVATEATSYQWFKGAAGDETNPIAGTTPSNERFVDQLYIDLLRRQADAAAISTWVSAITGGASRASVALSILDSNEYRTLLISDFYSAFLRRNPAASETAFWLPAFGAGITDEQFAAQILGSPEYFALAGSTNPLWVTSVFNDVLGRAPSASDLSTFVGFLATNSRATVAQTILTSTEERTRLVQRWFSRYLRRSAAASDVSPFVSLLNAGSRDEQVQSVILGSNEYFNFGTLAPTGPLSSTTSFWVKATNECGPTNSSTATVSIRSCNAPVITQQPQNVAIGVGGAPSISVVATSVGIVSYQWYQGNSGDTSRPVSGATSATLAGNPIDTAGSFSFWVRVTNACGSRDSASATVTVTCSNPPIIRVTAPPSEQAGKAFIVSADTRASVYSKFDLQESTTIDFANPINHPQSTTGSFNIPAHPALTTDTRIYFRARGFPACGGEPTGFSQASSTLLTVPPPANLPSFGYATGPCAPPNQCLITQTLFIGGFTKSGKTALDTDTFSVAVDKPYITANPSSGVLPPEGMNVTLTINTTQLGVGSTEATVTVTKVEGSAKGALGTTTVTVPVSVSLVTPVTPRPKDSTSPPPNTVLVPAIAHADGINSQFQSDVRVTNTSNQSITYQLTFTPSNTDGTQSGKQSSITIDAGETKALNDIVKNWYGAGAQGEGGLGTLEIRPTNYAGKTGVNVSFATVAASRTYNNTSTGTFGQYIPAIPLIDFLSKSDVSKISLQQVAQSPAFRTNLGFVEGSGQPVEFVVKLLDDKNNIVAVRPYSLRPFEHQQIGLASFFPGVSITDGRIELSVSSDTGKVTAYASVLDSRTSDPLLVFPVDPSQVSASRFVVPGVAEFTSTFSNFHTDMRIFNGSSSPTNLTLTFPSNSALPPVEKELAAAEVWAIDNVLPTLWRTTGGGAVVVTTNNAAPLVITARTFSRRDDGGTFGQFIPAVTATDAVGLGDRPLQVVQLEQSPAFRSNLGLVEVTGNPVTLDIAAFTPDSKIAAHTQVPLGPGQFIQLGSIFSNIGFTSNVYNGRIAVTVVSGTGRAAAYGSVVDNRTLDSTYVPAR
jgi:hypothetical protein